MIDVFFEKQCEAGEQADTNTMFFCAAILMGINIQKHTHKNAHADTNTPSFFVAGTNTPRFIVGGFLCGFLTPSKYYDQSSNFPNMNQV